MTKGKTSPCCPSIPVPLLFFLKKTGQECVFGMAWRKGARDCYLWAEFCGTSVIPSPQVDRMGSDGDEEEKEVAGAILRAWGKGEIRESLELNSHSINVKSHLTFRCKLPKPDGRGGHPRFLPIHPQSPDPVDSIFLNSLHIHLLLHLEPRLSSSLTWITKMTSQHPPPWHLAPLISRRAVNSEHF